MNMALKKKHKFILRFKFKTFEIKQKTRDINKNINFSSKG